MVKRGGGVKGHGRSKCTTTKVTKEAWDYTFIQTNSPICVHTRWKQVIFYFVTSIHAPIGQSIAFKKHVNPKRLFAMKTHDHHDMVQQILPLVVPNLLQLGLRETVIWPRKTFGKICAKVINPNDLFQFANICGRIIMPFRNMVCTCIFWFDDSFPNSSNKWIRNMQTSGC
jgi:hypothetical protein